MAISVKRENIAKNVAFTEIIDPKYKINTLRIRFITKMTCDDAPLNTMVSMLIDDTNSKYKTYSEMSDKLNSLYGAALYGDTLKLGDCQVITLTANCIENRYVLENEDILGELLDIAENCIFSPNVSDGKFDMKEFELKKRDLKESIYTEINNKRGYAINLANKLIYEGEACADSQYGTIEYLEKITSEKVYQAYQNLIRTSTVEIYYASPVHNSIVKERMTAAFSSIEREPQEIKLHTPSLIKEELKRGRSTIDMNQSKVVMAYKTKSEDKDASSMVSKMLGGTPFSKLFKNVREKMSLCYYCASVYVQSKETMVIDSGVEKENAEKLIEAAAQQLQDICDGKFTDEELENTKISSIDIIKSTPDIPTAMINWYFSGYCKGNIISIEQAEENIRNITRERVIAAAKSFVPDTVYILEPENNTESEVDDDETDC